jgi:hypothetical protein
MKTGPKQKIKKKKKDRAAQTKQRVAKQTPYNT